MGLAYSSVLVHCHPCRESGGKKADIVLEKGRKLYIWIGWQAGGRENEPLGLA